MLFGSMALSILALVGGVVVLLYSVLSFAHVKVDSCDMEQLQRFRAEGLLPDAPSWVSDFATVRRKLAQIAPAVYFRQEPWLHFYFYTLRVVLWLRPHAQWYQRQLVQCNAYQATRYRLALEALHALQYPSF